MTEVMVLSLAGIIILVGFLTNIIFKKTGVPDTLFLIIIGIIFGPLLNIISPDNLLPLAPVLGTLTLTLILFHGGLSMRISAVLSQSLTAAAFGFIYMTFATLFISLLGHIFLGLDWIEALMLGPMVAGTSSPIIMPLLSKLRIPDEVKTTLSLESVVTDALSIILVVTFLEIFLRGCIDLRATASALISSFAIGAFIGSLFGILWTKVLDVMGDQEYVYVLTIATLLLCFSITEILGGSGHISALLFGLLLGNYEVAGRLGIRVNMKSTLRAIEDLKRFHGEIVFMLRSFFLVILGLIYIPSIYGLVNAGVMITVGLLARYLATKVLFRNSPLDKFRKFMTMVCGAGLANATISLLAYDKMLGLGKPIAHLYPLIVTNVIVISNIITALAPLALRARRARRKGVSFRQERLI